MRQPSSSTQSASRRAATDAFAGALAGAIARTAVAPIDRIKLLRQLRGSITFPLSSSASAAPQPSSISNSKTALELLRSIVREEGLLSLWRGNSPTILIEAGSSALNFVLLNVYKDASNHALEGLAERFPTIRADGASGDKKRRFLRSFVSGGLAGATTITFLYPLAFIRTRLAVDVGVASKGERRFPKGMRDVVKTIWTSNGLRGFYKGYGIALVSVSLHRVVYLGGYDFIKSDYAATKGETMPEMPVSERFAAAQFVSMSASTVHYPLDSVRRRLMMEAGRSGEEQIYRHTFHCFRKIWAEEGVSGFYRGLGPNLARCIGSAVCLVAYDEIKKLLN